MLARRSLPLLLAASLALSACGGGADGDAIAVDDVRSRMSPMLAGVAAVYLDLGNTTDTDDALVGASVPAEVAASVELHESFAVEDAMEGEDGMADETTMEDDATGDDAMGDDAMGDDAMGDDAMGDDAMGDDAMMSMREVPEIALPAGATVELVPGGLHIMLIDLVEDLSPGDTFELTLEFEQADSVTVTAEVREDV